MFRVRSRPLDRTRPNPTPNPTTRAALDTLIGLQGDGFVLLAADPVLHRSLVVMQTVRGVRVGLVDRSIGSIDRLTGSTIERRASMCGCVD